MVTRKCGVQVFLTTFAILPLYSLFIPLSSASVLSYPYTVACPSEIRSNSNFKVITTLDSNPLSSSPHSVQFEFTIYEGDRIVVAGMAGKERFSRPGQAATFLNIPILNPSLNDGYKLSVKVTPQEETPTEKNSTALQVIYDTSDSKLLIQTDKPVYKPSDEVKYRVLVLDGHFRAFNISQSVIIVIRDPVGNIVYSVLDGEIPPKRGMISNRFTLPPETHLSQWSIKVYLLEKPFSSMSCSYILKISLNFTRRHV